MSRSFQQLFSHPVIQSFNPFSQAVFDKLAKCHTAQMGVHLLKCDATECGKEQLQYHCCGNRHCPHCGSSKTDEWIANRLNELLNTPYYHMVFTLPHELNPLIMGNRKVLFKALFDAASETLINHSRNPEFLGAEAGITMVLHTWGQDLSFHPHVHCIVTGGGFNGKGWVEAKRKNNRFLFPQTSMSKMYKAIFLKKVAGIPDLKTDKTNLDDLLKKAGYKKWNVYAKAPFAGPSQVVEYLGRYTHKVAISKHRILEVKDNLISFKYKDYADKCKTKEMSLGQEEFLRRFEQHILPRGFVKIRHYGFLTNKNKHARLAIIRQALGLSPMKAIVKVPIAQRMLEKYGKDITLCPICEKGRMQLISSERARPKSFDETINKLINAGEIKNKASPDITETGN